MPFDLDLSPAAPLLAHVQRLFTPAVADDMLLYAGRRVGVKAEELVSPYPPVSGKALPLFYTRYRAKTGQPYQSKFKSLKQQHKVMALVKQGKVPYKRTGTLGKSITSEARIDAPGIVMVRVGSNRAYAMYVIDAHFQSHYHLGNWTPIQEDIRRGLPELTQTAVNAVTKEVEKRLHG